MIAQLSLEILLSISLSAIVAGFGYAVYAHSYALSNATQSVIMKYASVSQAYYGSVSAECRCQ